VTEALGIFGLGDGFAAVEVGAAGVGPGVGAEVEAVAGTQGKAGLGLDFGAVAAIGLAGVVGLLFEVAELEVALVLGGAEFDTAFAGRVVEDEMVVATLPVPAGGELLGLEAGEAGLVGVLLIALAGEEGGGVGAGLLGAAAEAVAGGIGLAAAVVGGADDEGRSMLPFWKATRTSWPGRGTRWPPQLPPATGLMTRSQTPRLWLAGALSPKGTSFGASALVGCSLRLADWLPRCQGNWTRMRWSRSVWVGLPLPTTMAVSVPRAVGRGWMQRPWASVLSGFQGMSARRAVIRLR
jgi:hypothetical protein